MTDRPQEHESLSAFIEKVEASGEDKKHEALGYVSRKDHIAFSTGKQSFAPITKWMFKSDVPVYTQAQRDAYAAEAVRQERERIDAAMDIITKYGGIDGAHHKTWVIDQAARALLGDGYAAWVAELCDGEDGPNTYDYDEGINP